MGENPRSTLVRKMVEEGTSDDDIRATLAVFDKSRALPTKPVSAEDFIQPSGVSKALQTAKDVGVGVLKGAGRTVSNLGEMAGNAGMIPGVRPSALQPEMRNPAFTKAEAATTATNTPQMVGKGIEAVGELALPVLKGAKMIPSTTRAGATFQKVMGAAGSTPIDTNGPGQVGLRIMQLAERGGTMPRMVRQFVQRVTDPSKPPLEFKEARDFYSNISRLSADEYQRLTPVIQREIGKLKGALHTSLQQAADSAGSGPDYASAMREYAQAAKLGSYKDALLKAMTKGAIPVAGAAGTGYWLGSKLRGLVSGE